MCVYICIYTCMYIYTYMHTYIYTHIVPKLHLDEAETRKGQYIPTVQHKCTRNLGISTVSEHVFA